MFMEIIDRKSTKVLFVEAISFPEGIKDAHEKLHSLLPTIVGRNFFGISRPENGTIVYKAAAEELETGEAELLGCKTLELKAGKYISILLEDYLKDLQSIGNAFQELLKYPDIDPQGYCVEHYLSQNEVRCMVRLK